MTALIAPGLDASWAEWLVFADWLTEQGDERGELLVLESQLVDDPKNEQLRREIAERIEAWEDAHDVAWQDYEFLWRYRVTARQLPRLEHAVPVKLSALLSYPKSRILASVDNIEDSEGPRSAALLQLEAAVYQAFIGWIEHAFDGVPPPDEEHLTLYQAEAEDNYDTCDRSRDHLGRWQELPEQQLLDCQWSLVYLDEQGIHYYLPAVMCFALRYQFRSPDSWITESLDYTLTPKDRAGFMERFGVLTQDQRAAVCAYTLLSNNTEAFAAWIRVVEAETNGPREDWLTILCGS